MDNVLITESGWIFQGEGVHTGESMYMFRVAECNLKCKWCDERGHKFAREITKTDMRDIINTLSSSDRVLFTGGEPLANPVMRDIIYWSLLHKSVNIHVETNGTMPLTAGHRNLWVTVSPKPQAMWCINPNIVQINELKYVIDDDIEAENIAVLSDTPTWLMPCDYKNHRRNKAMVEKAVRLCKETGAKLGIQAHKFWGLD